MAALLQKLGHTRQKPTASVSQWDGKGLEFDGVIETKWTGLITTKMLFNSTVSTSGARFCTFDIKYFYYDSPISNCEYTGIQLESIPQGSIDQYNLETIQHEGLVYIESQKFMLGLKQSGKITNKCLCAL